MLDRILDKALDDGKLSEQEISYLFEVPLFSQESARIIAASRLKSERASDHLAEVHVRLA